MISDQLLVPPTVISSMVGPEHWKPIQIREIIGALNQIAQIVARGEKDDALLCIHTFVNELLIDQAVLDKQGEIIEH